MAKKLSAEDKKFDDDLAEYLPIFRADPLGYVMFMWDWGHEKSIQKINWSDPEGMHYEFFKSYREKYGGEAYTGSRQYSEKVLSLPLFPAMKDSDVERVITALHEVLA